MSVRRDVTDDRRRRDGSLAAAARTLQLSLSAEQSSRLTDFVDLLLRWNRTYNLTAIRDPSDALTHHVADSLAAVGPLRRELAKQAGARVLDVGSGGGLPGVVFAIMNPTMAVTCVDAVGKKTAFVRHAAASLRLENLRGVHSRVEKMSGEMFEVITSRAFASLGEFTALTGHLIAEGGVWMAMKGKIPNDEIATLSAAIEVFHVEPLVVPGAGADRCLIWMHAASKTRAQTQ